VLKPLLSFAKTTEGSPRLAPSQKQPLRLRRPGIPIASYGYWEKENHSLSTYSLSLGSQAVISINLRNLVKIINDDLFQTQVRPVILVKARRILEIFFVYIQ
jgi:hypothetical protein